MECALTLARRGAARVRARRRARPRWAATWRWLTRLPGLAEWGRVTAYRMAALKRLPNVELINELELTRGRDRAQRRRRRRAGDGLALVGRRPQRLHARADRRAPTRAPPTCSRPSRSMLDGQAPARGPRRRLRRRRLPRGAARWPSCSRARVATVEFVTGYDTIAPFCAETLEDALIRERLHACGVVMRTRHGAHGHRTRAA